MATRKKRKARTNRSSSKPRSSQALMAARKKRGRKTASTQSSEMMMARAQGRRNGAPDAISLLRQDHREVEDLFSQFELARGHARRGAISEKICDALKVHATIEEEIFYPKARQTMRRVDEDLLDEAEVEHEGIKWRVELIQKMKPQDDLFDAEVKCLKEYVEHHVKEEERRIFPKLRLSGFDSITIGQELAARKEKMTGKPAKDEPSLIERSLRAISGRNPAPPLE